MNQVNKKNLYWLWLTVFVIILDQISKYLALNFLNYNEPRSIFPSLNLTLAFNRGTAFSFFNTEQGWQTWLFGAISLLVSGIIIVWLYRLNKRNYWLACSLCLILGGALGNLIDRVVYGHVIDFIDVYYQQWHWYIFNAADSAITVGAIMLMINLWFSTDSSQSHTTTE